MKEFDEMFAAWTEFCAKIEPLLPQAGGGRVTDRYTETPPDPPLLHSEVFTCDFDYDKLPGIYGIFFFEGVRFRWTHGHVVFDFVDSVTVHGEYGDDYPLSEGDLRRLIWNDDDGDQTRATLEAAGEKWYRDTRGVG